jgi:hypothetical protein
MTEIWKEARELREKVWEVRTEGRRDMWEEVRELRDEMRKEARELREEIREVRARSWVQDTDVGTWCLIVAGFLALVRVAAVLAN